MVDNKPTITATIKFRGVTIEGMTIEELKALRDMLNELVADKKEFIPYPQPYPVYPVISWYGTTTGWTTTSSKITLGNNTNGGTHYTLNCN